MKGIVFTEFLEMVEDQFGLEMVDSIIEQSDLDSGGVYTAVGTYDYGELLQLVGNLSSSIDKPVSILIHEFARHLFNSFATAYPYVFAGINSSIEMLEKVEGFIHVEVKKLYPEAELPTINFRELGGNCWELTYRSKRPLADLCEGLIDACGRYFGDELQLEREDLETQEGSISRFILQAKADESACTKTMS